MAPENISFAGPGKQEFELRAAVASGILLNVESELELERISCAANEIGIAPRVAIRVHPSFELSTSGMKMGMNPNKQPRVPVERSDMTRMWRLERSSQRMFVSIV